MKATRVVIRLRKMIFRAIFKTEMNELSIALRKVKQVQEKNVIYRQMVNSLFTATSPQSLKNIKNRNGKIFKAFQADVKEELNTPTLNELLKK